MKHFPWEKLVLLLAASFAAYNYGLAGGYIEHTHFSVGGLIAGLVVNISLAIAASRYGSIKGDKRTRQAQIAFVIELLLSPLLVSPVIFYSLPDTFLGSWILRAAWAIGWPLVADLAIVLAGAVSGKGLIAASDAPATLSDGQRRSQRRSATSSDAKTTLKARSQSKVPMLYRCECGFETLNRNQFSGHQGKCATHQQAKAGQPIALDTSLLINKGDKSKP